jgi:uncharacterized cupredoxin-like copper-binding protein
MPAKILRNVGVVLTIALSLFSVGLGPVQAQTTRDVKITLKEFSLTPNRVSVPRGQAVRFTVTNAGTVNHNFTVELESQKIEKTLFAQNLKPGETKTAEFTFTAAGEWEMYCPVDAHKDRGMLGKITVATNQPTTLPRTGGSIADAPLWLLVGIGIFALSLALRIRTATTQPRT